MHKVSLSVTQIIMRTQSSSVWKQVTTEYGMHTILCKLPLLTTYRLLRKLAPDTSSWYML